MSIYTKAKLGVIGNQVKFNDDSVDPYYRAEARASSKWQIRQQDLPVPFESGNNDFLTLLGDSAYIIAGHMYPSDETTYDSGINQLRTVCSLDVQQADADTDTGYVPYTWGDAAGDYSKQIFIKPLYVQFTETTRQGYVQAFTIYSKVKDPTIFGGSIKAATTQSANFSQTTGSAVFPITFPVVVGSTLFTVSSTATNNGTLPGYPASVIVHGPVNVPKVTNTATGEFIKINTNMSSSSDILNITYDKDTLSITLNGISQMQNLSTDSTLFKLQPGANNITLTGSSVSTLAYAVVNYYDTYPLA